MHHLCHYDLQIYDDPNPSASSYRALTNVRVPSSECTCASDVVHNKDYESLTGRAFVDSWRLAAETKFVAHLMSRWSMGATVSFGSSTAADAVAIPGPEAQTVSFEVGDSFSPSPWHATAATAAPASADQRPAWKGTPDSNACGQKSLEYLTDSAERAKVVAKERKEAGIKPKKRPKVVEEHYDDLGG